MRMFVAAALVLLTTPLAAQETRIRDADLPREYERLLLDLFERESATRIDGSHVVQAQDLLRGGLAVSGGDLRVEGRVDGDVGVVDGDLVVGPVGEIAGDVVVVGGAVRLVDGASVGGDIVEFSRPTREVRTAEHRDRRARTRGDRSGGDRSDGDDGGWTGSRHADHGLWYGPGSSTFLLHGGPSYNRVEGLPLHFGPSIRTGGSFPLHVEALAIWRTAAEPALGTEDWGYRLRVEHSVAPRGMVRVGGSAYSVVRPLDRWRMSDTETALATLGFHQDFRDHLGVEGWSAFAGLHPLPWMDVRVEYREESHTSVGVSDPWTLFGRSHRWRPQPLVGEGELRALTGSLEMDLRGREDDPHDGWYGRMELTHPVGGSLTRPALSEPISGDLVAVPPTPASESLGAVAYPTDFTSVFVDLRRYAPVGPSSQLAFRFVGGGTVDEEPLPPQFQHVLGGPGSLPGFAPFHADCGARESVGLRDEVVFHPGYGCDRFVLGQVEYRGSFTLDLGFGEPDRDGKGNDRDWKGVRAEFDPRWTVFANGGQGWAYDRTPTGERLATGPLYDAGGGILLDDLGIYFAVPLNGGVEREARFFVRLQRRF